MWLMPRKEKNQKQRFGFLNRDAQATHAPPVAGEAPVDRCAETTAVLRRSPEGKADALLYLLPQSEKPVQEEKGVPWWPSG